jgi:histidinol-phosphate phosphatase family protein
MGKNNIAKPAVFLDRDGTLIFDRNYLSTPEQVKLYSYAAQSVNKLKAAGFKVIVVTNQSGISRGMFGEKELAKVHKRFLSLLKDQGAKIDGLYYCPHIDEDKCACRKPKTGMLLQAAKDHNIDISKSYTVGDSVRDYLLGYNAGAKGLLVLTGHGKKQSEKIKDQKQKPLAVCKTLKEAVNQILKDGKTAGRTGR